MGRTDMVGITRYKLGELSLARAMELIRGIQATPNTTEVICKSLRGVIRDLPGPSSLSECRDSRENSF